MEKKKKFHKENKILKNKFNNMYKILLRKTLYNIPKKLQMKNLTNRKTFLILEQNKPTS